jgi:ABC-type polysaccharide/polyol phosphate transport system ATPase subunit
MVSGRLSPPVNRRVSPSAITVDRLVKCFRIARQRPEGSKMRWLPRRHGTLEVLRGVSFAVEPGELFGLMGRNGSGKSTLLKIISGVYPADSGTVRIEGRLAPALQLGVGFSPELSASENAAITAVMLGLSRREARLQVDSILDFADLREFSETRLKDLSHGMRMRLAFAALIETDPDLLLVDEILAVGDRAFQEKCTEAFAEFRRRGRTIVLVSHATGLIERLCDRALLLENGQVEALGDARQVAARYIEVNVPEGASEAEMIDDGDERRRAVEITEASLSVTDGLERTTSAPEREIAIEATLLPQRPVERPGLRVEIRNERGGRVFLSPTIPLAHLVPGMTPRVRAWVEDRLHPGDYSLGVWVVRPGRRGNDVPASPVALLPLRIPGDTRAGGGAVALRHGATLEQPVEGAEVVAG